MIEQIKERLGNGFRPFALCLSDGRKFTVPHRDLIARASRIVVVIDEREISHVINPLHIVSLEDNPVSK